MIDPILDSIYHTTENLRKLAALDRTPQFQKIAQGSVGAPFGGGIVGGLFQRLLGGGALPTIAGGLLGQAQMQFGPLGQVQNLWPRWTSAFSQLESQNQPWLNAFNALRRMAGQSQVPASYT